MGFGEKLKLIRKEKAISQEELADILGVSRQAVSKWESGVGYPEIEKLILLSTKLDVSIDYLLKDKEKVEEKYEQKDESAAVVIPRSSGRISIVSSDGEKIINCMSVKSSKIIGNGKGPKYVLNGITKVSFLGEKSELLGWYKNTQDIKAEIDKINEAISAGLNNYTLKYCCKVEYRGIFAQPYITE